MSLHAAMRVCKEASVTSPAREWRLLDRVASDRCAPGQQVLVRMDGVPAIDPQGRYAHVRSIYLRAQADMTMGGTNDVVTAYQLRSLFASIFLRDCTGWNYLSDIDARTLLDDQFFRWGSMLNFPPLAAGIEQVKIDAPWDFPASQTSDAGLATNLGAGTEIRDIGVYMPLTGPGQHPLRGLVPLAIFQRVSNNALTIRIGSEVKGAPAGVTFNNLQVDEFLATTVRAGMDVWVEIVWLSALVVDAPTALDNYTLADLSGTLLHPERLTSYAWIRYFPEDAAAQAGQDLVSLMDGLTVTVAGFTGPAGERIDDTLFRTLANESARMSAAKSRSNAAQSLPLMGANGPTALPIMPYRYRQQAPVGPINFRYETRGAQDWTRYVHRTVARHTPERGKAIEQALGLGPCSCIGTNSEGLGVKRVQPYEPTLIVPLRR